MIETNGIEAERHLYRCLLSSIDFNSDTKATGKDYHQTQLLKECLTSSLSKPSFASILCYAIENQFQESTKLPSTLAEQIGKLLRLTLFQQIEIAIILQDKCSRDEIRRASKEFLIDKLRELNESYSDYSKLIYIKFIYKQL